MDMQESMFEPLTLRALASGWSIQWNGSHTFNVYDSDGANVDVFTWYGEGGEKPSEMKARELMREHMAQLTG